MLASLASSVFHLFPVPELGLGRAAPRQARPPGINQNRITHGTSLARTNSESRASRTIHCPRAESVKGAMEIPPPAASARLPWAAALCARAPIRIRAPVPVRSLTARYAPCVSRAALSGCPRRGSQAAQRSLTRTQSHTALAFARAGSSRSPSRPRPRAGGGPAGAQPAQTEPPTTQPALPAETGTHSRYTAVTQPLHAQPCHAAIMVVTPSPQLRPQPLHSRYTAEGLLVDSSSTPPAAATRAPLRHAHCDRTRRPHTAHCERAGGR